MCLGAVSSAVSSAGCGGGDAPHRDTTPTGEAGMPNPLTMESHVTIPLEAGELHLGAVIPGADQIALVLASRGELVLFACDHLEAETARNRFVLGSVAYERDGNDEKIGGMVRRDDLMRLATEGASRLRTCDEEIELDAAQREALSNFLTGREPPPPEQIESRSIALEGLTLGFSISDRDPDMVQIQLRIAEPMDMEDCDIVVIVQDDVFPLGLLDLHSGGPNPHRSDFLQARLPRANVQNLVMEEEASLIVCGDVWILEAVTLQNIRTLVGTPIGGIAP
jgi:hypothetical protein